MKKYAKFIFPAICVIIVVVTFILIFNLKNKVEKEKYNVDEIEYMNLVEEKEINNENVINEIGDENVVENTNTTSSNKNDEISNSVQNESTNSTASAIYEQNSDVGSTDKKQEAIDLVRQKWGEDDSVIFRCDSVTGNGEYIIAVVSKSSASVKNYFVVNLDKNTVEVSY